MNKARRKRIDELFARIELLKTEVENLADAEDIKSGVDEIRDEEQDYFDNMPESLQGGDKGNATEECIEQLQSAADAIEEVSTAITEMQDRLQEALDALDAARSG